ncbi:hypothetical protein [Nocardia tengchongensis]|uniref:hypothetical protein n=1 Tax=Nocardia tengchongensis TaxID=2055889 RepID=UPI00367BEE94
MQAGQALAAVGLIPAGNASTNTATDHKTVLAAAFGQLPCQPGYGLGRTVLVRIVVGGGTYEFISYCHCRHVLYSIGVCRTETLFAANDLVPAHASTPDCHADRQSRDGAARFAFREWGQPRPGSRRSWLRIAWLCAG